MESLSHGGSGGGGGAGVGFSSSSTAPSSLVITPSPSIVPAYKTPMRPKGHYRSSSLENNPFAAGSGGKCSLSLAQPNFTGTLKSRREQKRISDFLSKQSLHNAGAVSNGGSLAGAVGKEHSSTMSINESTIRKAHFENIREIFEKNNSKNAYNSRIGTGSGSAMAKINGLVMTTSSQMTSSLGPETPTAQHIALSAEDKPPKIQSCSGILGKGKQVIRPIAFKPVPYKCNTPNYTSSSSSSIGTGTGGRLTDLGERFGSTPSLGAPLSIQYKFGSTTDLHHHHNHHHHHGHQLLGTNSTGTATPSTSGPSSGSYSQQYGTLLRKSSAIPFKTYDSLESILKIPDSMSASYPNPSTSQSASLYAPHDLLDMAPSPSDSGISELEAALRDRDSELAYLRQTMEHNEQDKEKHWEQELNRLKSIHESRLRAGAQKVHKLEQLLMMQTFQLRQDKKRLQDDINRLHSEFTLAKEQAEHQKTEICHLKLGEKDLKEQNADLMDEIQMLRRVVSDLKERLEESEWSLCQRNGEVALMKSQLKDAQADVTIKDQEILQLRSDMKLQNYDDISLKKSEITKELDFDLEISQLNRIIIFKDQIIVVMNNEIQKLRKELSDISIMRGYEGVPPGRYSRYKKKLEYVTQKFEESTAKNDSNNNNNSSSKNIGGTAKTGTDSAVVELAKKTGVDELSSSDLIRNYFNNKLEVNKKLFLNTQICNYSDEDKSSIIENYNATKLPDITLDLSSIVESKGKLPDPPAQSYNQSSSSPSSDDDYKSMTPTRDQEEDEDDEVEVRALTDKVAPVTEKLKEDCDKQLASDGGGVAEKDLTIARLRQELQDCRSEFEQERLKWADEKEKVLIYQRQLQQNYVEMSKRTAALEEQLKTIEPKQQ